MSANVLGHFSQEEVEKFQAEGRRGIVGIGDFQADFYSFEKDMKTVTLTSGGVWIVLRGEEFSERVLFVQQADRENKPWEIASGKVDKKRDKDIWQTIIEEVHEETGIAILQEQIMPLAVAIKRGGVSIPVALPECLAIMGDFWVDEPSLDTSEELTGGLIGLCVLDMNELPIPNLIKECRKSKGETIYLNPPKGVNRREISKIALVPLEDVLEGKSTVMYSSSHMWAHIDGLQAFIAAAGEE